MNIDKKQEELIRLKKRCFIFFDYHYEKYGHLEMYKNAKKGIQLEFEKQNLVGLRLASKDLNNWLREMPSKDAQELSEILKRELGEDINIIEKKRLDAINKVVKKGKINRPEEYELLLGRVDEIYADPNKKDEVKRLNELLGAYHKSF